MLNMKETLCVSDENQDKTWCVFAHTNTQGDSFPWLVIHIFFLLGTVRVKYLCVRSFNFCFFLDFEELKNNLT